MRMLSLASVALLLLACTQVAHAQDPSDPLPPDADAIAPASPLEDEPALQPPAEPIPEPPAAQPAPMPQYDGQLDAQGRAYYTGGAPPDEDDDYAYEDPSYPEATAEGGGGGGDSDFKMPPFSIRIDPFNWLIEGRLGFELEVGVLDFMTIELVPVLVANAEPPTFNFSGRDDPLSQESNGLGPLAGASLGVGFWLSGTPLYGYVLRVALTNIGITYKASNSSGVFDRVSFTERRLIVMLGSHTRFGIFTLAGGIGLGYELNQQQRCFVNGPSGATAVRSGCPDDGELHIALNDPSSVGVNRLSVADLNGWLHPVSLEGRFSIGVSFD